MEFSDEDIERFADAVDLSEYLIECNALHAALRCLLDAGIIEYPEWLDDTERDT